MLKWLGFFRNFLLSQCLLCWSPSQMRLFFLAQPTGCCWRCFCCITSKGEHSLTRTPSLNWLELSPEATGTGWQAPGPWPCSHGRLALAWAFLTSIMKREKGPKRSDRGHRGLCRDLHWLDWPGLGLGWIRMGFYIDHYVYGLVIFCWHECIRTDAYVIRKESDRNGAKTIKQKNWQFTIEYRCFHVEWTSLPTVRYSNQHILVIAGH